VSFAPPLKTDPYEFIDLGFKVFETVVQNDLSKIDNIGFSKVISALHEFAKCKHDTNNISFAAIEMLRIITDNLASGEIEATEEKVYEFWTDILVRLKELGCDERSEIRSKIYTTIESIFNDNAEAIPGKVWNFAFHESLAQLLQFAELNFMACRTDVKNHGIILTTPTNIATPKFSMGNINSPEVNKRIMRFDEEAIKKEKPEEISKLREKMWEESIINLLSCFLQVFKRFHESGLYVKDKNDLRIKTFKFLIETLSRLMKRGSFSIINSVLRGIQQLSYNFKDLINSNIDDIWLIFQEFMIWINMDNQITPYHQRPVGARLSNIVIDALKAVFNPNSITNFDIRNQENQTIQIKPIILSKKTLLGICELLRKVFFSYFITIIVIGIKSNF